MGRMPYLTLTFFHFQPLLTCERQLLLLEPAITSLLLMLLLLLLLLLLLCPESVTQCNVSWSFSFVSDALGKHYYAPHMYFRPQYKQHFLWWVIEFIFVPNLLLLLSEEHKNVLTCFTCLIGHCSLKSCFWRKIISKISQMLFVVCIRYSSSTLWCLVCI